MSVRSCALPQSPLPDRESPARGNPGPRRPAPSRLRRKSWRFPLPLPVLLGAALLMGVLCRAGAVGQESSPPADPSGRQFTLLPEEGDAPGARVPEDPGEEDWALLLVNGDHPLPKDFQVPELTRLRGGHAIDKRAYPALQRMMDACRAEGLDPLICSSYRSWEKQEELYERKVRSCLPGAASREEAEERAAQWVARPGSSEHQAGLAVDIVDRAYQLLDQGQEETAVQKWLMAHCAEYGFILRYPTEKSGLTGVNYEPWHYRYVGEAAAGEITDRGLCLEEYAPIPSASVVKP